MALRPLFFLIVCSCALTYLSALSSSPFACLQSLSGAECQCGFINKKLQVLCSCEPVKILDLRNLSQEYVVTEASVFRLENCGSTSVLVFPEAFSHLGFLGNVIFHNISRLTLEPYSISINSWVQETFTFTFSLITNLSIRRYAINIRPQDQSAGVSIKIQQSSLISLMRYAFVGKLRELTLEKMQVKARPWPEAIVCQGSEGASVNIRSVSIRKGLTGRWITGNISRLSIIKSNVRLMPDAFAGVNMVGDKNSDAGITLFGNIFLLPSLPSHALPSQGSLLLARKNYVICRCPSLAWLLEPPYTMLKEDVKASLRCKNKNITSVLAACETPSLPIV